jgi:hypothetical protein
MEVDADLVIRVLVLLEVHGTEADRRRELARLPAGGTKRRHRCPRCVRPTQLPIGKSVAGYACP